MPPRKRARLASEERAVSPSPMQSQKPSLQVHTKPVMKTKKTKRARTPTFTDTESEGEGEADGGDEASKLTVLGRRKRRKNHPDYYDVSDPFIDDSELAQDERTFFAQTKQKGFYVSSGQVALLNK